VAYQIAPGLGLDASDLNANIRRHAPANGARQRAASPVFADFTGQLRGPVLSLHTTGDGWVPFSHQQRYHARTVAAGTDHLLVQRAIRRARHCDFSIDERMQAFDDLVGWLEGGPRPDGDDVNGDPATLGLRWTRPLHPGDPSQPKRSP
jgi:hypothetical protein